MLFLNIRLLMILKIFLIRSFLTMIIYYEEAFGFYHWDNHCMYEFGTSLTLDLINLL